ncbi:hypothetical protein Ae331Ps2_6001c [Pseudonocardia sp. Ae331_Ps2]|nr:hypothetical protein Ae331Ps2_6001c [Pseudonocardia sp. Ae331_Ps2]
MHPSLRSSPLKIKTDRTYASSDDLRPGCGLGVRLRRIKLGVFSEKTPGPSGSARCARLLGVVGGRW